ncbi:MAG TPA: hypothetical protein VHS96_03215 [Bacteroidia bacterium]|nr:hypothetical protein [Bacteroidia bacterium]
MKLFTVKWLLVSLGSALLVAGLLLPLWSKNGIGVNGFEQGYLTVGRWIILAAALAAVASMALPRLRKSGLMGWAGLLALAQACLVLWKGYKLGAIGPGAWLLLAGAALILANALLSLAKAKPES